MAVLRSGVSELDVARMFLESSEYQSRHSSNTSFISALYVDLLGRPVDNATLTNWDHALQNGMSRDTLIRIILTSDEMFLKIIDENYQNILHRTANPGEEQAWLISLKNGTVSPGNLTEQILASLEFYTMAVAASQN